MMRVDSIASRDRLIADFRECIDTASSCTWSLSLTIRLFTNLTCSVSIVFQESTPAGARPAIYGE